MFAGLFSVPKREYAIFILVTIGFIIDLVFPEYRFVFLAISLFASYPVVLSAFSALLSWRLSIEVFNLFALVVTVATGEVRSAAFITLMLAFARLLEWHTEKRTNHAVRKILDQKPKVAYKEEGNSLREIPIEKIRTGDILIVRPGEPIPADGIVVFGKTEVNEALVTGESLPVEKIIGDEVLISTVNVSQPIKIKATRIGRDSTLEKMARLIETAEQNKSTEQKLADVFAGYFFPFVLFAGVIAFFVTGKPEVTVSLFLVACADDIAVAIPLAVTASLGHAARRGVIIKGGRVLRSVGKARTLVLDKTGTLTYGNFMLKDIFIDSGITHDDFWQAIAIAEKYSEHPIGKVLLREALKRTLIVPNAQKYQVYKGAGVQAKYGKDEILVGNEEILKEHKIVFPRGFVKRLKEKYRGTAQSIVYVAVNNVFVGYVSVSDTPRSGAKESLAQLRSLGISRIVILTGDKEEATARIAEELDISEYYFGLRPEDKLLYIERFSKDGPVIMIGDGINDAPALARASVGIAMGKGGSAIASETADIIMLHDNLAELPHLIDLGRGSTWVMYSDIGMWFVTNVIGFALVLTGVIGPSLAALYNFVTDFIPILNSTRLFSDRRLRDVL